MNAEYRLDQKQSDDQQPACEDRFNKQQNLVLESVHPSPLSANRGGWFGQHQFSRANNYLAEHGLQPVVW